MIGSPSPFNSRTVRTLVLVLTFLDCGLIGLGLMLVPTTLTASQQGWLGVVAALAILTVYGTLGALGSTAIQRRDSRILPIASVFGLVIGSIFVAEMLLEYAFLPGPKGNERLAYLEFGGMFVCLLLAGFKVGRETTRVWFGVLAATWSTLLGSLTWVASLLLTYYTFLGTPRQEHVLAADQVFEDFKRSGMTDLRAFVMQDYLGGVFFHLLLGLILAVLLGAIGGAVGKLIARWWKPVRSVPGTPSVK